MLQFINAIKNPKSMYVYIYMCKDICAYISIYVHICMWIYIYMYIYICIKCDKYFINKSVFQSFPPKFHFTGHPAWSTPEIAFKWARAPTPAKLLLRPPGRWCRATLCDTFVGWFSPLESPKFRMRNYCNYDVYIYIYTI